VNASGLARLVEANARFTRPETPGQHTLPATVYAQRRRGAPASAAHIEGQLRQAIVKRLSVEGFELTPLVDVTVLD
jgi:hypothetical protein